MDGWKIMKHFEPKWCIEEKWRWRWKGRLASEPEPEPAFVLSPLREREGEASRLGYAINIREGKDERARLHGDFSSFPDSRRSKERG